MSARRVHWRIQAAREVQWTRTATLAISGTSAPACLWIVGHGVGSASTPGPLPPGAGLSLAAIGLALLGIQAAAFVWAWRHR